MRISGIKDKVIVYTGAAGIIGKSVSLRLAENGASLILVDTNVEAVSALYAEIRDKTPSFKGSVVTDLDQLSESAVGGLADHVERDFGRIDVLINSAYPRTSDWHLPLEKVPLSSWRKNIDDHLNGYFNLSKIFGDRMIKHGSGNIINFSSIYGLVGPDFTVYDGLEGMTMPAAYAAIKGAVTNYTRYLASYLGKYGIRVNAVCPGGVYTSQDRRFVDAYQKKVPLGRMADPDDIAGPVLFLVSDLSRYVTGVNLPIDGGWTAI
ncbi:MAG: SDR family oxidoreductase [Oligoflexales bacterium]|nr:SDR family oxidoreductase [Oligoflexales bacterium]